MTQPLSDLLERLAQAGIRISAEGDKLVLQGRAGALDARLQNELRERKAELLAWLTRSNNAPRRYPLNAEQTRLWFMDKLSQNDQGFVLHASFLLRGTLDTALWQHAVAQTVERHAIVSARLAEYDNEAWLEITGQRPGLELCPENAPHTLPAGQLFRVMLQPCDGHHRITFLIHHIIADRTSMAILINDCFTVAGGGRLAPAAQFTEVLQTTDQTRETPEALAWWRNTLDGAPAEISLPLDHPRPAERGQRAGMLSLPLPDDADLSDIARANGATPFMAYLALYAWLLQRWSGDDDMVIGCPVSTRKTRADQDMVGFMVSTVPLRLQPDLNDDLATRITQVKHALLGALGQSGVTLDQMVSALNPKRHLNRNPLFQAMFVLQAQPLVPPTLHDTTIEALPVAPLAPEVDLNLSLERTSDPHAPWLAQLEYDPDLFDERTIRAFLTQFVDLCRSAAAQGSGRQQPASPHAPALWQGPSASLPDRPIHDLILDTLHAMDPGTVLLTDHHGSLSCAQVLTRIERTADALHAHGVTRQTRVGLCLPRLTERVPTLLALWQCGGCAVFLPTDGPTDAILTRARQAGISILVTGADSPDLDGASAHDLRRIACQTLLDTTATACPPVPFPPTTGLDVLPAYVCFTSGSTGEPKTVFISHASLLNHALDTRHRFGLQPHDRVLQFAAPAFDVALEETLPALLAGAPLVQPAPAQTRDLDAFEQALTQHGISVANLPAAFWHTWVHERVAHGTPIPPSLRLLITGSEAVQASAARIWRKQAPHCALMCGYGLTETTISASFLSVDDVPASWSTLPLGTPVPNTEIAVTGPDNQLLPPLCVGDIRVRGQALMLSAARDGDFTPLAELHTGDRGRMDLDGQLWCLGRRDRQIKIRGIRVEPATLERALIQIPGITDAAALVRQTGSRHRLWAFITGANAPSQDAIKATLQNSLADVLIPEHILTLPSLPVTSQGKTDYRALAHLADSAPASATVSPLNSDHERLVAQLFSDVLQRHPIGPDDNFFDLGGDSISSLQVISRARRAGLELSAKTIFEHQTVRAIARNAAQASSSSDDADAIGAVWSTPILSWFKGEMHGNWRQFNQAVVIALPDPVDLPRLQQALQAVVACHEIFGLQVSRSPQGAINYHIRAMRPAPLFEVEPRADGMDDVAWTEQRQTRLAQAQQQLDPERGINVAAVVLPSDRQMMLTVHHLCIDVLSWQVVLRDLQNAYEHPTDLPLRRHGIPWRRWALALQAFSRDPEVTASLPFWVDHLSPRPTPLAPDLPAHPGLERDARTCQCTLPTNLTQHLLRKVPAVWKLRMDETLLAALALAHAAGHGRILRVDLERNGRALPIDTLDISETVGWFTSVIPLCLPVNPDARTMAQTITTALAALPHDGLGYGLLRYGDDPDQARRLAALPGADILVNYVGVLDGWTDGPFQPVDADTGPTIAPDLARSHRLELNAGVVAGQLRLALNFAAGPNSEAAAQDLMHAIASALENIAVETGFDATAAIGADDLASPSRVPVTPLQRGILLHSLHNPQTYFNQIHFKLDGPLDPEALKAAWAILLSRHAALRCTFDFDVDDEPYQSIASSASLTWQVFDWSALDDQRADPHLRALMQADRQQGFALGQAPLMRMLLIRRGHDRHDWVWSSHHLIMDGWSVSVLMQELLAILKALGNDTTLNLPAAPDWAAFVRRWNALDANAARCWWQHALADASPSLMALPTAQTPRSAPQHSATRALDPVVRDGLSALCRQHGVPLGVALQASWALLLRRYRSTETVVFGITFAYRPADFDHADALVGMTINTVPVCTTLTADMTLATLLGTLRQQSFERADHAFIGLDDILQSAGHDPSNPLFDTLLLVQNYPRPSDLVANGLTLKVATLHEETNFALTAIVTTGDDAALTLAWDPTRIDDVIGTGLLGHWYQLLSAMVHQPMARVQNLSLYTGAERAQRVALACGPDSGLSAPLALDCFNEWAHVLPGHPAIQAKEGSFSYGALKRGVDTLCQTLLEKGVAPGEPVALLLPRGARAVTALLAVMQAGAMAVPIDAAYPAERIAWILGDSNARWLLTDMALTEHVPASCTAHILPIDQMPDTAAARAVRGPDLNADDPAYLIYTSGSTGQPKGAITPHGGLASMIRLQRHHLAPEVTDRVLQFAALSFDASIWEIFMALGSGATLHIPDPEVVRFGEELLDTIENDRITIATLPPSLLVALPKRALPSLRLLMVAGEACPDAVVEKWASGRRFFNGYGPSEASVCSNLYEAHENARRIPIGKPGAHCRAYVMDLDGHLVPPGGQGELVIGGDGVGLGYLNRPDLTAGRFRPDPWQTGSGHRIYHSGDRVDVATNGELTFCGRIDRQFKLRGFRVEPGEIERQLEQLGPIDKALVGVAPHSQPEDPVLLAWVLPRAGHTVDTQQLRHTLAARLPAHLVPGAILTLSAIPLTPNGKINWSALPLPGDETAPTAATLPNSSTTTPLGATRPTQDTDPITAIAKVLEPIWAGLLKLPKVNWQRNFFDLGGQSLLLVKMQPMLRETFNIKVPTRILFEHATIQALAQWLAAQGASATSGLSATPDAHHSLPGKPPGTHDHPRLHTPPLSSPPATLPAETPTEPAADERAIAIIGMACRFPGADSAHAFWALLREGREGITDFSIEPAPETLAADQPHHVPRRGVIPDADQFDAAFFGIGPRDALLLDPQHRLLLEGAWHAFEDAAELPGGNVGVFAGCSHNTWLREVLVPAGENIQGSAGFHAITANDKDFLATQIAYRLNLSGPAVTVQSACSTSLIAVAQAVDALRAGRCDMALAGGVSLTFPESDGYVYEPGMILSPDGHCRPFAADAAGTVPGAGMGVVLLKPLVNALNDGNRIYATIRGTGVSNDGARKMSFAAPGIDGQAKAVQDALADAGLDGSDVDLIEAHGTGTSLGDPVEITALGKAYAGTRARPLLIGSVKSNIGHADAAAGVAGLIKATLSLHHRYLPPSLHAGVLNPKLDPGPQRWFDIARHGVALAASGHPLRAGVSSFGIGGTNAHLILEEAPTRPSPPTVPDDWQVIPLSAAAPGQLPTSARQLARHLETTPVVLADVATTLQSGRPALKARKALVANTVPTLIQTLSAVTLPPDSKGAGGLRRPARIALLLPGQGAQHAGMGRALLTRSPGFTTHLAEMSERLEPLLHLSLMDALNDPGRDAAFWQDTRIAQPAIVAVSLACAQWWTSLGIKTDVMLGHSLGEYTAACLAGVFSTDAVLQIVTERARLMAGMPAGAMLAVALDETGLNSLLLQHSELDLAALNGPRQGVVSGPADAIEALANDLKQRGIPTQRLRTSHAFHSRAMAPAASALGTFLANQTLNRPTRKFISNLTGTWITPEQAVSPDYWARHMLAPVRFAQGLQTLQEKGAPLIIEAGPGHVLSTLARSQGLTACPSLDPAPAGNTSGETAPAHIQSVARLWESGIDIDWNALTARRGQRIALPGYPWARQVFRPLSTTTAPARPSVPSTPADPMSLTPESDAATLGLSPMHVSDTPCVDTVTKPPEDDWFYTPRWVRHPLTAVTTPSTLPLVLLSHTPALANPVAQALRQWGRTVRVASSAQAVLALPEHERGHLVIVASAAETMPGQVAMTELRTTLLAVRDLILAHHPKPLQVDLLTIGGAIVQGNETACPANTARVAALQVLAVEFPEHHFAGLDLAVSEPLAVAQRLHAWLDTARAGRFLAWRQGQYWTEQVKHCAMPAAQPWPLPKGATVLITGAAGGVGHAFALDIARTSQAPHLLLTTHRTPLPPARQRELESLGATVSTLMLDLADEAATTAALTHWQHTVGPVHGVIHAAGLADYGGIMARRDAASIDTVLAPKIVGLCAIENALAGQPLDAVVLCSTLGSFLPAAKFGQAAYSAANAWLDTAAAQLSQRHPWRVVTINWDDWVEAGMTVAARARAGLAPLATESGLLHHEGPAAVRRVLPTAFNRVAISVNDLPALMARQDRWISETLAPTTPGMASAAAAAPPLSQNEPSAPKAPPADKAQNVHTTSTANGLNERLQALFREILNVASCTPEDNFFDLGGHSLLAMQLISRLREDAGLELTLIDLFAAPTPEGLAQLLNSRTIPNP